MWRVLIVSPHFPPSAAADVHRVRTVLPFLREYGWEAEILSVVPDQVAVPLDPWLADGVPSAMVVHRVRGLGLGWTKFPGLGGLGFRALYSLANYGDAVFAAGRFDLVYFSTTVFEVLSLGPRWTRRFGVPFAVDYQDPWVNDYYTKHREVRPPGGRLKYWAISRIHRWMEPAVLREAAGITSVSDSYPKQLAERYPETKTIPTLVEPFPAPTEDFVRLAYSNICQREYDPGDGLLHWVYVGAVIPAMHAPLRALFRAVQRYAGRELIDRLRLHFIGTSYAPAGRGRAQVVSLATEFGLDMNVTETVARVPYSTALACMRDANALLVFGSDDESYVPSKLLTVLLAAKPTLALCYAASAADSLFSKVGGVVRVAVRTAATEDEVAELVRNQWLSGNQYERIVATDAEVMARLSDKASARSLCSFFETCVRGA